MVRTLHILAVFNICLTSFASSIRDPRPSCKNMLERLSDYCDTDLDGSFNKRNFKKVETFLYDTFKKGLPDRRDWWLDDHLPAQAQIRNGDARLCDVKEALATLHKKRCLGAPTNNNALAMAVLADRKDIVSILIDAQVFLNEFMFDTCETPLSLAIRSNYSDIATDLIRAGAQVNNPPNHYRCSERPTPIHYAVINNMSDTIEELVKRGANSSYLAPRMKLGSYEYGVPHKAQLFSAVHYAAYYGHSEILLRIIHGIENPTEVLNMRAKNVPDKHLGETALHMAAQKNNAQIVEKLLQLGANPFMVSTFNVTDDFNRVLSYVNKTPLLVTSNRACIKLLLRAYLQQSKISPCESRFVLPVCCDEAIDAIKKHSTTRLKLLLKENAHMLFHKIDFERNTLLTYATNGKNTEAIRELLWAGSTLELNTFLSYPLLSFGCLIQHTIGAQNEQPEHVTLLCIIALIVLKISWCR